MRNAGSLPTHVSEGGRGPGIPALGISLGLHGAALTFIVLFWAPNPPEPYAVIAVELVQDSEVVGSPGKDPGEQQPLSQAPETAPAEASDSRSDMRQLAYSGAQSERPVAFEPPGESDGSPVAQGGEPAPGNGSDSHETVPPAPTEPVFAAEKAPVAEASTEVARRIPPPPPSKPLPPNSSESPGESEDFTMALDGEPRAVSRQAPTPGDSSDSHETMPPALTEPALRIPPPLPSEPLFPGSSTGLSSVRARFEEKLLDMKGAALQSESQESELETAHPDAGRATAPMQQTAALEAAKSHVMAALPASVRSGGIIGSLDGTPETHPSYAGDGLSNAPPRYPYLARRRGQEGRVVLRVRVNAGGDPTAVRVRQSSGYRLLDDAAVATVETWRFVPANQGGIPVAGAVDVPVSFKFTN